MQHKCTEECSRRKGNLENPFRKGPDNLERLHPSATFLGRLVDPEFLFGKSMLQQFCVRAPPDSITAICICICMSICVCICRCTKIYIYIDVHTYLHTYLHTYIHTSLRTLTYAMNCIYAHPSPSGTPHRLTQSLNLYHECLFLRNLTPTHLKASATLGPYIAMNAYFMFWAKALQGTAKK